jgi:hypothetical protein
MKANRLPIFRACLVSTLFVLAVALVSGCAALSVKTDYDRSIDFSQYTTYKWMKTPSDVSGPRSTQSLLDQRVKSAVDRELATKGLQESTGQADLLITYHAGVRDKVDVSTYRYGYRGWGSAVDVQQYSEGTLIIDLIDAEKDQLVWRGWGTGVVDRDPSQMESRVNKAVTEILAKFPPKP